MHGYLYSMCIELIVEIARIMLMSSCCTCVESNGKTRIPYLLDLPNQPTTLQFSYKIVWQESCRKARFRLHGFKLVDGFIMIKQTIRSTASIAPRDLKTRS